MNPEALIQTLETLYQEKIDQIGPEQFPLVEQEYLVLRQAWCEGSLSSIQTEEQLMAIAALSVAVKLVQGGFIIL